jgi:hypothetical protein
VLWSQPGYGQVTDGGRLSVLSYLGDYSRPRRRRPPGDRVPPPAKASLTTTGVRASEPRLDHQARLDRSLAVSGHSVGALMPEPLEELPELLVDQSRLQPEKALGVVRPIIGKPRFPRSGQDL